MAIEYVCFATPAMEEDMPLVRVDRFIPGTKKRAARVKKVNVRDPLAKINVFAWKAGVKLSGGDEMLEDKSGKVSARDVPDGMPVARAGAAIVGPYSSYNIAAAAAKDLNEKQYGCTQTGKIESPPVRDETPDRTLTQLDLTEDLKL